MSDLAAAHASVLDQVARDAGMLTLPAKRGVAAGALLSPDPWPTEPDRWSRQRCLDRMAKARVELGEEFFRDACDDTDRASEGDAVRSAWPE